MNFQFSEEEKMIIFLLVQREEKFNDFSVYGIDIFYGVKYDMVYEVCYGYDVKYDMAFGCTLALTSNTISYTTPVLMMTR